MADLSRLAQSNAWRVGRCLRSMVLRGPNAGYRAALGLHMSGHDLADAAAALYRPFVFTAIGGLVVSGTFNFLTKPGHQPVYHALFGIKILLALHVFAVSILIVKPKNPRRVRMMTGVMISGLIILAISAWLRSTF